LSLGTGIIRPRCSLRRGRRFVGKPPGGVPLQIHARKKKPHSTPGLRTKGNSPLEGDRYFKPRLSRGFLYLGELSPEETEKAPCRSRPPNRRQGHPPTGRGLVTTHPRDGCVATSKKVCLSGVNERILDKLPGKGPA
jgi:hypothetical protein